MQIIHAKNDFYLEKEHSVIASCCIYPETDGVKILDFCVDPRWRRRGYGSYLLKEVLRITGGYDPARGSLHWLDLPSDGAAFWAKFGFVPAGDRLIRRRPEELTAVKLTQKILTGYIPRGGFAIDATCGNGHDTAFLCHAVGNTGHVLALDIQAAAIQSASKRLQAMGCTNVHFLCADHARLKEFASPESADAILFNFGWLPGADHSIYTGAGSSIPALESALSLLKPGGVLSAVLYSGKGIGDAEKQAALAWMRELPLNKYTVLVCNFANWADTAPLPCLILKK